MQIFKKNISKKTWLKIILFVLFFIFLSGYLIWDIITGGPLISLLNNRDAVISTVNKMGVFAPLSYLLLQFLQTIFAPIPGQVVGGVGGFIFGWWGITLTLIGSTLGYIVVVLLARRFGRPLLEKIFKKSSIEKFDFALGDHAAIILFLIFLLPGFPDDMVGYMAGLTNIPFNKLLALILIGRLPTIIITNYVGMGLSGSNLLPVIIISLILVIFLALLTWQHKKILNFLKSRNNQPN